jgi:hypothetical protein
MDFEILTGTETARSVQARRGQEHVEQQPGIAPEVEANGWWRPLFARALAGAHCAGRTPTRPSGDLREPARSAVPPDHCDRSPHLGRGYSAVPSQRGEWARVHHVRQRVRHRVQDPRGLGAPSRPSPRRDDGSGGLRHHRRRVDKEGLIVTGNAVPVPVGVAVPVRAARALAGGRSRPPALRLPPSGGRTRVRPNPAAEGRRGASNHLERIGGAATGASGTLRRRRGYSVAIHA